MSYTSAQILEALDALAAEFQFPGFDNEHYDTADSRMHGYCDSERWALVIEEIVSWQALLTTTFTMGNFPTANSLRSFQPIETSLEVDPDSYESVVPEFLSIRGEQIELSPTSILGFAKEHRISNDFAILIHIRDRLRDVLFCTEGELRGLVPADLPKVLCLQEWNHPDVYGGTKPSESETFQKIATALASGSSVGLELTEPTNNRDWRFWRNA